MLFSKSQALKVPYGWYAFGGIKRNWKMERDVTCGSSHLLSFLKHPEERSHGANVEGVCGDGHDVVQDASHLPIKN